MAWLTSRIAAMWLGELPIKARLASVCVVSLALYLATLSCGWTSDSLLYALDIESGDLARMVDPYHLLLHPLGWLFYRLWQGAGWSGGSLLPLQVLNALGGAVCAGLVYTIACTLTGSARAAALAAAGVAVSGGLWLLSVEAEFVTVPLAAHLAVLWCVLGAPREWARRPAYALGLGLAVILAALFYLTGLVLLPVAIVGFVFQPEWPRSIRLRQAAIAAGVVLSAVAGGLLFLATWRGGGPAQWWRWLGGGSIYGQLSWANVPRGAYAFLRTLALYPGLAMNDSTLAFWLSAATLERGLFVLYYLVVLAVAALPLLLAWRRRQSLCREHPRELAVLGAWTALYGALAVYWVPGDVSFWVPLLAAWWLLAALAIVPRLPRGPVWMLAIVGLLLIGNALLAIVPRRDLARNLRYALARELAGHTAPADLILLGGDAGLDALYAAYFGPREVVLLSPQAAGELADVPWFGRTTGRVQQRGGRIFAAGFAGAGADTLDLLCASAARALGRPCPRRLAPWQVGGSVVWELCVVEGG